MLLEGAIVPLFALALAAAPYAQFTSGVSLVEVYATVTDRQGGPVTGLTAADFRVLEDGSPETITAFAAGEFPLAVAVAVDRSFSMSGERGARLNMAKSAARAFIGALKPQDQVMVIAIGPARPAVFAELATASGGRSFLVRDPRELSSTLTSIARELRSQYLLGYVPSRETTGERSWHSIDVTVNRAGAIVRARDGYFGR